MATQDPKKSAPTLDRVDDGSSSGVPQNGETTSTTLTLRGTIDPNSRAEILDNDALIGHAIGGGSNTWSLQRSGWSVGLHKVKLKTAAGEESPEWRFTVNG
jgi:hypothetical protein